jgi:hypothetical protein
MTAVAARARGRLAAVIAADAIDQARDLGELGAVLGSELAGADDVERIVRDRMTSDLAILQRWSARLAIVALDEDRRSLRALVRGLVARVPAERRLAGTTATPRLSPRILGQLARAETTRELAIALGQHPFASVFADAATPIDLVELEAALARRYAELARTHDRALQIFVEQVIDAENAGAALLLAARGAELAADEIFVEGGRLLDRAAFLAAAHDSADGARDRIARSFAGTPVARAVYAASPSALEDAALAWHVATQARLRRTAPLGLAPALYLVLRRRDEVRRIRRVVWRLALEGAT